MNKDNLLLQFIFLYLSGSILKVFWYIIKTWRVVFLFLLYSWIWLSLNVFLSVCCPLVPQKKLHFFSFWRLCLCHQLECLHTSPKCLDCPLTVLATNCSLPSKLTVTIGQKAKSEGVPKLLSYVDLQHYISGFLFFYYELVWHWWLLFQGFCTTSISRAVIQFPLVVILYSMYK